MRSSVGLKQNSTLQPRSSLNRGNTRLSTQTRIKARAGSSGRIIDGIQIWSLDEAHNRMSKFIRKRDGKCLICKTIELLTCSHFHRRDIYRTAFDPENLITLCLYCHMRMETEKEGEYLQIMINLLGESRFKALNRRAHIGMKKEKSIIECMKFLGAL